MNFHSMMALAQRPWVFVCAKSNFNLVLLIDVTFYFKCLWKYPTTVLCGPASNETHSRMPLVTIRSLASTQSSPRSVFSVGPSMWQTRGRGGGFSSSPGSHLWNSVRRGSQSRWIALFTEQLCWCCQPQPLPVHLLWATWAPEGLAHQRRGWRVQEQVFRGQLFGFTFDLLNVLWCLIVIFQDKIPS